MKRFVFISMFFLVLFSCRRGDFGEVRPDDPLPIFSSNGIWLTNEGQFGFGNGEISFIDIEKSAIYNNVFFSANGISPGDIPFDVFVDEDIILLTVNNSGRLWVLQKSDFKIKNSIHEIISPRFIQKIAHKKYAVSSFANDSMYIVDLNVETPLVSPFYTGKSTENMVYYGNILYASNWSSYGGNYDNTTVQLINPLALQIVGQIKVGKEPNSMVLDKNDKLWVLCSGGFMNEEKARLFRINTASNSVEQEFEFPNINMAPVSLSINPEGDRLYFLNGDVYEMSIDDVVLPAIPFVESGSRSFYGVNAFLLNDAVVVTDAGNYQVPGQVIFYNLHGVEQAVYRAGIIPGNLRRNY